MRYIYIQWHDDDCICTNDIATLPVRKEKTDEHNI